MQETADALHIHRNTLQKRLANVEQLLGIDLGDLDAVVDLRLGLHAAELRRRAPSPEPARRGPAGRRGMCT